MPAIINRAGISTRRSGIPRTTRIIRTFIAKDLPQGARAASHKRELDFVAKFTATNRDYTKRSNAQVERVLAKLVCWAAGRRRKG